MPLLVEYCTLNEASAAVPALAFQVITYAESVNSLLPPFGERTWTAGPTPAPTVNVAVTAFTASIVTTQLPVPVHAPVQPVNVDSDRRRRRQGHRRVVVVVRAAGRAAVDPGPGALVTNPSPTRVTDSR